MWPAPVRPVQPWPRVFRMAAIGNVFSMLTDILIAVVIVAIAAVLGIVVHPVLWVIVIAAVLWLFVRRGSRSHSRV